MYGLGIDVGLTETRWAAIDGGPGGSEIAAGTVDSVVALVRGELIAGSELAAADPADVEHVTTEFARRLGDTEPIMIAGTPYGIESLVARLISSVVSGASRQLDGAPSSIALLHDDGLDDYRSGLLVEAARLAGIPLDAIALVKRSEARTAVASVGETTPGGLGIAAGAARIGLARRPDVVVPDVTAVGGAGLGAAAGGAAAVAGGAVLGVTAFGGEAIAAGPVAAGVAGLGPTGSPLAMPTVGPAGTPISPSAGPAGTPISPSAGPAGTPISPSAGPAGTPISPSAGPAGPPISPSAGPAGPAGTPLETIVKETAAATAKRSYRKPIIAGAMVAVGAIVGVGVLAAGNDDPEPVPEVSVLVIDESSTQSGSDSGLSDSAPVVTTAASTATETPTTTAPAGTAIGVACTAGTWTMDNDSFAAMWLAVAGAAGGGVTLDSVDGAVIVEVGADGVWTSTYSDWGFTASADDFTMTLSITGDDRSTGTFSDDGSFTFVESSLNTVVTMTASAGGVNVPIPPQADTQSAFRGSGTFVCDGDSMTVNVDDNPGPIVMNRTA